MNSLTELRQCGEILKAPKSVEAEAEMRCLKDGGGGGGGGGGVEGAIPPPSLVMMLSTQSQQHHNQSVV